MNFEFIFYLIILFSFILYNFMDKKKSDNLEQFKGNEYGFINCITLVYLSIPVLIFLIGWCKFFISFPLSILLIFGICSFFKKNFKRISLNKKNFHNLLLLLVIALIFVLFSGIGGYAFQNSDHWWRNSIFDMLISEKWPVILSATGSYDFDIGMVYYLAIWLPAALIGKLFGLQVAYFAFYLWCTIGVFITYIYIIKLTKLNKYLVVILFILFSGLDILNAFLHGQDILNLINSTQHIEWITNFQFSSITTQLFWVFNQALPAWLFTMLLISQKSNRYLGFIFSLSLIYCTLPSMSLAVIVIYKVLIENRKHFGKNWLFDTFSIENIFCGIPLLFILSLYIKSNISGGMITIIPLTNNIIQIIVTLFCEIFIYLILIFKYQKNNKLFYLLILIVSICPFISINGGGDFCMRVSIPAIILLFLLVLDSLNKSIISRDKIFITCFIIIFTLGSMTPLNEFKRTILNSTSTNVMKKVSLTETRNDNFFGKIDDSIFFKYIAK